MPKGNIEAAAMILHMIQHKTGHFGKVDYFPQKPEAVSLRKVKYPFARVTPESCGVPSALLSKLLHGLADREEVHMHKLLVLRHGALICECNFAPYRGDIWHITHSMCKSVTGMAIGFLVAEGRLALSENIFDIFSDRTGLLAKMWHPVITVEDLLTMQSGVRYNETGAVADGEWLVHFLESSLGAKPGEVFEYNSMNSYVLSAIVTQRTKLTMLEYLRPRLFEPLGIENVFWEESPEELTKGGWGMFMMAEDMAKLGQLYLDGGRFRGEQILPEAWVADSVRGHSNLRDGRYHYGYQIWLEEDPAGFIYSGMLGQDVVVWPDLDMVVVLQAANADLDQNNSMMDIVRETFRKLQGTPAVLPEDTPARMRLHERIARLESGVSAPPSIRRGGWRRRERDGGKPSASAGCMRLAGHTYEMEEKHVGLFPFVMQVLHNNLTDGISEMAFSLEKERFYLHLTEGETRHKIRVGFLAAACSSVTEHGESYLVAVRGQWKRDEEDRIVLIITMSFLEEAMHRILHITLVGDGIIASWREVPGKDLIIRGISGVMTDMDRNFLFQAFKNNGGAHALETLLGDALEPRVRGRLAGSGQPQEREDMLDLAVEEEES